MSYVLEWNPLLDSDDVKKTIAKLHLTFVTMPFMSINQVLKIVIPNTDAAEVYAKNGTIYYYQKSSVHNDRLEQYETKQMSM